MWQCYGYELVRLGKEHGLAAYSLVKVWCFVDRPSTSTSSLCRVTFPLLSVIITTAASPLSLVILGHLLKRLSSLFLLGGQSPETEAECCCCLAAFTPLSDESDMWKQLFVFTIRTHRAGLQMLTTVQEVLRQDRCCDVLSHGSDKKVEICPFQTFFLPGSHIEDLFTFELLYAFVFIKNVLMAQL